MIQRVKLQTSDVLIDVYLEQWRLSSTYYLQRNADSEDIVLCAQSQKRCRLSLYRNYLYDILKTTHTEIQKPFILPAFTMVHIDISILL